MNMKAEETPLGSAEDQDQPIPTNECQDCGQSFKTAQGLAGHRRLAHSTSTARALDERKRSAEQREAELKSRETAAVQRAAEAARSTEAVKHREAEVARRQRELEATEAATEAVPKAERLRRAVQEEIAELPEVTEGAIFRVRGTDYRIEDGRLVHLYWPKGEKTDFEEGRWFQFAGRAYAVRNGKLCEVSPAEILAEVLEEEV